MSQEWPSIAEIGKTLQFMTTNKQTNMINNKHWAKIYSGQVSRAATRGSWEVWSQLTTAYHSLWSSVIYLPLGETTLSLEHIDT